MCGLTQRGQSGATGTPPKLGWDRAALGQEHIRPAMGP